MTHVKFNRRPLDSSFNNLLDGFFSDLPVLYKNETSVPVNIHENEKDYVLEVVAPGFDKSDFKINIDQNILTVAGEKKSETKDETAKGSGEKQIRREYSYRSFKRSFTVDEKIDAAGIEAKYVNGVLTLNLPRKAEVKASAKEITIQ